jgi:hypothetical protein
MDRQKLSNASKDNRIFGISARAVHKVNSYVNRRRGGFRL